VEKLDKRKIKFEAFIEALDINNLENHYIMSDQDELEGPYLANQKPNSASTKVLKMIKKETT